MKCYFPCSTPLLSKRNIDNSKLARAHSYTRDLVKCPARCCSSLFFWHPQATCCGIVCLPAAVSTQTPGGERGDGGSVCRLHHWGIGSGIIPSSPQPRTQSTICALPAFVIPNRASERVHAKDLRTQHVHRHTHQCTPWGRTSAQHLCKGVACWII